MLSYFSVNIGILLKTVAYTCYNGYLIMSQNGTTLKVKNTTRDRLAKRGSKLHTYDMIIVELLNAVEVKNQ